MRYIENAIKRLHIREPQASILRDLARRSEEVKINRELDVDIKHGEEFYRVNLKTLTNKQ